MTATLPHGQVVELTGRNFTLKNALRTIRGALVKVPLPGITSRHYGQLIQLFTSQRRLS